MSKNDEIKLDRGEKMNGAPTRTLQADVVIAGSGPGGATVARELSRKGKKVIVCEAGKYHKWFGNTLSTINMLECKGMTFSKEGNWIVSGRTAGGGSVVYGGLAFKPPEWLQEKYGIDLKEEVDEFYDEVPIGPLPDSHIGPGARKIMEAARKMGLDWKPIDRLIRAEKCKPDCDQCMSGCKEGAKWTAREYLEDAVGHGSQLLLQTEVDRVLTESGDAVGVRAKGPDGWMDILADTVIVSAGGFWSPRILQRSGLYDAGQGFAVDFGRYVVGPSRTHKPQKEIPGTTGASFFEEGFNLVSAAPKPMMYAGLAGLSGPRGWARLPRVLQMGRTLGVMMITKDRVMGRINADGSFSKPIDEDCWAKLNKGTLIAEQILQEAGVRREDVTALTVFAAHQVASVRIGGLLDKDCQTPIKSCYCMDASVIPEEWGLPPMVTIVSLAKRLAKHLTASVETKIAERKSA
jgi:choline dehydrogenase-like flavoprotein